MENNGPTAVVIQVQPQRNFTPIVPPGLEYLVEVDQILVHQKIELLEACCGCETKNKYEIKNAMGQKFFYAKEDTNIINRCCCGPARPFDMDVYDNAGNLALKFERPLACQGCCFPCCLQNLTVTSSQGEMLGSIHQEWTFCTPRLSVKDSGGNVVFIIKGRICLCYCCCSDVDFKLYLKDGETQVGKITKQWSGFGREFLTDADHFGIKFPMDLDVKMKAVLLGACMLIDFMYFEKK